MVKSRPLNSINRDDTYPADFMPFYLYGEPNDMHISHMLVHAPNVDLSASGLTFSPSLPQEALALLPKGLILGLSEISEEAMQPFPSGNENLPEKFFFRKANVLKVEVWKDPNGPKDKGPGLLDNLGSPLYTGQMTLGKSILVDLDGPNKDPYKQQQPVEDAWQDQLDTIGDMLKGLC